MLRESLRSGRIGGGEPRREITVYLTFLIIFYIIFAQGREVREDMPSYPLFGNEKIRNTFLSAIEDRSVSHAFLMEGEEGTGKKTLVRYLIQALSCENGLPPCGTCRTCKMIASDICPDVHYIEVEKGRKFVSKEQIDEVLEQAHIIPNDLEATFFVFTEAHRLNIPSQNCLLKLLEEPPDNVYFFLLCPSAVSLLPTVRSRVQSFRMQRFSPDELDVFLKKNLAFAKSVANTAPEEYRFALKSADGKIGAALTLVNALKSRSQKKKSDPHLQASDFVCNVLSVPGKKRAPALDVIWNAGNDRETFAAFLDELISALRDLLMLKRDPSAESRFFPDPDRIAPAAAKLSVLSVFRMIDAVSSAKTWTEDYMGNLNLIKADLANRISSVL